MFCLEIFSEYKHKNGKHIVMERKCGLVYGLENSLRDVVIINKLVNFSIMQNNIVKRLAGLACAQTL